LSAVKLAERLKRLDLGDALIRRNPFFYRRARALFAQLANQPLAARRDWLDARLKRVLDAARSSPYGRRAGGGAELSSWPLLEKSALRAQPEAFRARGLGISVRGATGGTTGMPLTLVRSLQSVVIEQAALDLLVERLGVQPGRERMAVLRADSIKDAADRSPPYWIFTHGGRRMVLSPHHLCAETLADYARALSEFGPDVLWVYPTAVESLCRLLLRAGLRLSVLRLYASSEILGAQAWQLARLALGAPAIADYYGQAERVAFAMAFEPGAYRFLPGYSAVELVRFAADGESTLYEIVGTSLWNLAMPLVRYRTGDLVRLPAAWGSRELEEVALGERAFGGVLGRSGEFLLTPEGVRITGINHFPRYVGHVRRIQVIQERVDEVRLLVLAEAGYAPRDAERLLANVRAKLPPSMRVSVELCERLEQTPLGKTPFVIHRPAVRKLIELAEAA
jgi:phenylacetate-CoA ligase